MKTVAVMSMVATPLKRQYTGLTAFGNESSSHDIAAWRIDDEYEDQIREAITRAGLFQVIPDRLDRTQFAAAYDLTGPWDAVGFRVPNPNKVAREFQDAGIRLKVDGFVVVLRSEIQDIFAGTNQWLRGVGIYSRGFGDTTKVSMLHVVASVYIVDAKTGLTIAKKFLTHQHSGWAGQNERTMPRAFIAPEISRTDFEKLSKEQLELIRAKLIELPKDAWEPTIRAMKTE
jgi:hypothetical protein